MLFNTLEFAVFFPIVFFLYWAIAANKTVRNAVILLASYYFYGYWDWRFLLLIFTSSLVDYLVGLQMDKAKKHKTKKALLFLSLFVNLGFLFYFKYTNFFIESFVDTFRLFGKSLNISTLNIILPVGISFYTFQTLSYTIDIYKKKIKPSNNPLNFFAFVAFFPQLVAGPIERASHLLPQFNKTHRFDYLRVKNGLLLVALGLFKKMVIADRVAILVNQVYNNPEVYHGFDHIIATVFFAFQIYCDFSGYSDIAIGISRTMGFDLMKNFDSPYFSKSITEFWRRWHISLSTWFRDYVYIPLGGSRNGRYKTYLNLFIVFVVSGIWHGAAWTFVIWGVIHGTLIVVEKAFKEPKKRLLFALRLSKDTFSSRLFFMVATFTLVSFAWIFFRANSFSDSLIIVNNIFVMGGRNPFNLGLDRYDFYTAVFAIIFLLAFERFHKNNGAFGWLCAQNLIFRWIIYTIIFFTLVVFGTYGDMVPKEFIYFQF